MGTRVTRWIIEIGERHENTKHSNKADCNGDDGDDARGYLDSLGYEQRGGCNRDY
jgi:hypothetical protein